MLRFANQPNTTGTGRPTRDGHDSAGDAIRVEIYDPATNETVDTDAVIAMTSTTREASIGTDICCRSRTTAFGVSVITAAPRR